MFEQLFWHPRVRVHLKHFFFKSSSCQEEISGTSSEVRKSSPQISTDEKVLMSSVEFEQRGKEFCGLFETFSDVPEISS